MELEAGYDIPIASRDMGMSMVKSPFSMMGMMPVPMGLPQTSYLSGVNAHKQPTYDQFKAEKRAERNKDLKLLGYVAGGLAALLTVCALSKPTASMLSKTWGGVKFAGTKTWGGVKAAGSKIKNVFRRSP